MARDTMARLYHINIANLVASVDDDPRPGHHHHVDDSAVTAAAVRQGVASVDDPRPGHHHHVDDTAVTAAAMRQGVASVDDDDPRPGHHHHVDDSASGPLRQWFVFEHLPLGDLKQFLRRHRLASTANAQAEPANNTLRWDFRRRRPLYLQYSLYSIGRTRFV